MRNIKFRVWDKVTKQMCPVWHISFKSWDEECSINYVTIEIDGTVDRPPNEVELMQYSGAKDKNKMDIYEGDIIKFPWGQIIVFTEKTLGRCYVDEVERIGNIYENPELLR